MRLHIGGGRGRGGFSRFVNLHIVKQHAASRKGDSGGMFPEKMCNFVNLDVYFDKIST